MIRNKRIKVLSFLLTVSILSTLICIPVCAKQNEKSAVIAIQNAIQSIAFEKEHYGFSSVNLSDIWIGNSIPTYSVEDSTISKSDDLEYYPLLDTYGNLISMAIVKTENDEYYAFLAPELAITLNRFIKDVGQEFALIFDRIGAYFWDGTAYSFINSNDQKNGIDSRTLITDVPQVEFEKIFVDSIEKESCLIISPVVGYDNRSVYIDAPMVQQTSSNGCWAACIASAVKHETGISYTCRDIAYRCGVTEDQIAHSGEVWEWLQDVFGFPYERDRGSEGLDHVVLGGFNPGHMMIIRGVDYKMQTFSVMDPASSIYNMYRTGQIVVYHEYTPPITSYQIPDVYGNVIYILSEYLYML